MLRRAFLASLPLAFDAAGASPGNWPGFRGPDATGVSGDDPRLPERWSATENILWKTQIQGAGWSSPIVWGNRVFVTAAAGERKKEAVQRGFYDAPQNPQPPKDLHHWDVFALDFETGRIVWRTEVHRGVPNTPRHPKNSYASETPVTDGAFIYAHFGNLGAYCLDWKGRIVWSKKWPPHATVGGWGTASSPLLDQERLYILDDNAEASNLLALDKKTGREIWRVVRHEQGSWATPYIWRNHHRTEIVVSVTNKVQSYDWSGQVLWELRGTSHNKIASPFSAHGLLYISAAYGPVYAIRPGASGDISLAKGESSNGAVAWSLAQGGSYTTSPLVYGDYYYTLHDRGFLTCHEATTGREVYGKQRIDREAGEFTSSPWAYNGRLFCLSEAGDTFVVAAGPEFNVLRKNSLEEFTMATPAIAQGSLILRTESSLFRIGKTGAETQQP